MVLVLGRMNEITQDIKPSNSPTGHELGALRAGPSKHPVMPLLQHIHHGYLVSPQLPQSGGCRGYVSEGQDSFQNHLKHHAVKGSSSGLNHNHFHAIPLDQWMV